MTERTMRLRLGLFVIVAGTFLGALILMFGSLPTVFKRTTSYTVRFIDAPGLTKGAPVRRSGVRIGTVTAIELDEDQGIVRVYIALNAPFKLRRNEQPTLVSGLLGGDTSIDLLPRQRENGEPGDREPLAAGDEVIGVRAATVNTLLRGASDVVPTTQETLNDIRKSIKEVEKLAIQYQKMTPLVEATVREYGELARAARGTMPEFLRTNSEIRELASSIRTAMPEVMKTNKEAQDFLRNANGMLPSLERTNDAFFDLIGDVRKNVPVARSVMDDIGAAARNATRLTERADVMLQTNRPMIEQTLKDLARTAEQATKLLSDENIGEVRKMLTQTGKLLSDENINNVGQILTGGRKLLTDENVAKVAEILHQGSEAVQRLNINMKELQQTLIEIQRTIKPLGDRSERISKNIDEITAQLNQVLGDVRGLIGAIDRSQGTFKKFLTDPSLYNNIDNAAVMINKLVPRLDRILKDFEVFADKLARHPELLGAQGAIRGSDGLKYPPTPPINSHPVVVPAPGTPFLPAGR
jgi:ABC-type transporter Mla subunit MlaD